MQLNKFRTGDYVKCINKADNIYLRKDQVYIVKSSTEMHIWIDTSGKPRKYNSHLFVKSTELDYLAQEIYWEIYKFPQNPKFKFIKSLCL